MFKYNKNNEDPQNNKDTAFLTDFYQELTKDEKKNEKNKLNIVDSVDNNITENLITTQQNVSAQNKPSATMVTNQNAFYRNDNGFLYRENKNKAEIEAEFHLLYSQLSPSGKQEVDKMRKLMRKKTRGRPPFPSYIITPFQLLSDFFKRSLKFIICLILLIGIFMGGLGGGILYGYISSTTPIPTEMLTSGSETSYIYDKNGNVISLKTGALNIDRVYVPLSEVKQTYIDDAFIAIEDERFKTHIGIDPKRILSAVISALLNSGTPTHGGSTITQQVVKLVTGNDQRSTQRKFQEWYRAVMLDKDLTKDEIMELYINFVPMGNSYVGIASAAQGYFGKDPSQLNLAECALLAGLPQAPSLYSPRTENGLRNALRRQRIVLNKMYELGFITKKELTEARNTELVFKNDDNKITANSINSYFTEYAFNEAIDRLVETGYTRQLALQYIQNGGLHIYTSFDPEVQKAVDATFQTQSLFQQRPEIYYDEPEKPQGAMVVIDNQSGNIVAMAGGFGEKKQNLIWNRAVNLQRQPGSSIKPLIVYGPALDMGKMVGSTIIDDSESFLNGKSKPWPTNYDMKYHGKVTFRNALKGSLNVPAVKILKEIGVDAGKKYLKDVGIDWTNDPVQLAAAVGAPQKGVSPLLMAQAYATFANGGVFRPANTVTKIEDKNKVVIFELKKENRRVYSPQNAYIMTTMLQEVTRPITSNFNYLSDAGLFGSVKNDAGQTIPTAGKTGTTDDNTDKWFCGYTPYYTAAVWYGFDNKIKKTSIPAPDYNDALRIWHDAMHRIHANLPPKDFVNPGGITTRRINIHSGLLMPEDDTSGDSMTEWYVQNSELIPDKYDSEENEESSEDLSDLLSHFYFKSDDKSNDD